MGAGRPEEATEGFKAGLHLVSDPRSPSLPLALLLC